MLNIGDAPEVPFGNAGIEHLGANLNQNILNWPDEVLNQIKANYNENPPYYEKREDMHRENNIVHGPRFEEYRQARQMLPLPQLSLVAIDTQINNEHMG